EKMTYSQQRSQRGRLTVPAIGCPRSRPPRSLVAAGMVGLLIGGSAIAGPWVNINPGGGGAFTSIGAGPTGIIVFGRDLAGTDRGQTWKVVSVNFPTGLRLLKLVVSPTDPSTVYLVSGGDLFVSGTPALYRSTDGGVSWTRVAASIGNVWDLAMDPVTPSTL